jgi:hypothetical protein
MGLLENLTPPEKITSCKVRTILTGLDEKDKQVLIAAIDNPAWAHEVLSRELKLRGLSVAPSTIKLHRQKACSCSKI